MSLSFGIGRVGWSKSSSTGSVRIPQQALRISQVLTLLSVEDIWSKSRTLKWGRSTKRTLSKKCKVCFPSYKTKKVDKRAKQRTPAKSSSRWSRSRLTRIQLLSPLVNVCASPIWWWWRIRKNNLWSTKLHRGRIFNRATSASTLGQTKKSLTTTPMDYAQLASWKRFSRSSMHSAQLRAPRRKAIASLCRIQGFRQNK